MTTRDARLMVGGRLHAQHYPVLDHKGSTAIAYAPPIRWETGPCNMDIYTETYNRQRMVTASGHQDEVWVCPDFAPPDLAEALRKRGLPNMVSVLLPSRGRVVPMAESLSTLLGKATHPSRIEVLVVADPDDPATVEACHETNTRCWVAPKRYGYSQLNEYFNGLEERASGEWVLLWNDDARMLTHGWDEALYDAPDEVMVADLWVDGHSPDLCTFPAVRRHLIAKTGGVFSPWTCHCDTWWQDIGRALGVIKPVEIKVDHQRSDLRPGMHLDLTRREALSGYRSAEFYGEHVQGKMREAIERAAEALYKEKHRR